MSQKGLILGGALLLEACTPLAQPITPVEGVVSNPLVVETAPSIPNNVTPAIPQLCAAFKSQVGEVWAGQFHSWIKDAEHNIEKAKEEVGNKTDCDYEEKRCTKGEMAKNDRLDWKTSCTAEEQRMIDLAVTYECKRQVEACYQSHREHPFIPAPTMPL